MIHCLARISGPLFPSDITDLIEQGVHIDEPTDSTR
jgi:hypothetical protein